MPKTLTELDQIIENLLLVGIKISISSDHGIYQSTIVDKKRNFTGLGRTFLQAFQNNEYFSVKRMNKNFDTTEKLLHELRVAAKNWEPNADNQDDPIVFICNLCRHKFSPPLVSVKCPGCKERLTVMDVEISKEKDE